MIFAGQRDPHGLRRWFYHEHSAAHAATLRGLFDHPHVPCRLSFEGVQAHLGLRPLGPETTCFAEVKAVRPGHRLFRDSERWAQEPVPLPAAEGEVVGLLAAILEQALAVEGTALALSGGLDSALLLGVVRRVLGKTVPVFSLCPLVPGYSERERILATARALDVEPQMLEVAESDFVEALAECVYLAEVPLYNLHPVSKLLLAKRLKQLGFRRVITGDGADQVFAGVPGWDYLPIVGALFEGANVDLCCPFLDERVLAWAARRGVDPHKTVLRAAGQALLPDDIVNAPKVGQLAPAMNLSEMVSACRYEAGMGALPPQPEARVTLALLIQHFPRLQM